MTTETIEETVNSDLPCTDKNKNIFTEKLNLQYDFLLLNFFKTLFLIFSSAEQIMEKKEKDRYVQVHLMLIHILQKNQNQILLNHLHLNLIQYI